MSIADAIRHEISAILKDWSVNILPEKIVLEQPDDLRNGDYSTNAAKILKLMVDEFNRATGADFHVGENFEWARILRERGSTKPIDLANALVEKLTGKIDKVVKIEARGAGFINFYLADSVFAAMLENVTHKSDLWGKNDLHKGEKIMVEYTDPNPFKEFHIGHLMSNAIGEAIVRLMEFSSAEVKRANYQGDVGPHVAKAIWAMQKARVKDIGVYVEAMGKFYAEGTKAYEENSAAKEEIDVINRKVYDASDPEINFLYSVGRSASLEHFEDIYKILGTKFDHYFFESETAPRGMKLVQDHKDVFAESDGAIVYKGEQDGLHTRVFITSRGTPTYETKDLGLLEFKQERGKLDESITVTAHEQADYFKVMIAAAMHLPEVKEIASKTKHVTHGMMRFAEGKMSSRTGNVITGESLLADVAAVAKERAAESRADDHEQLSKDIAVAAIKYQILRQASGKDIVFDRERALSLEGDSGPYIQYTYARATQIVARAESEGIKHLNPRGDTSWIPESAENLVRLMYRFPAVVERAAQELEPHLVANFLIEFAASFNRWYAEVRIVDGDDAPHKVAITEAARITLKNGLYLLGIPAPEKM